MSNDLKWLRINYYLLTMFDTLCDDSFCHIPSLPWRPFLGHRTWSWTTLTRADVFYYVYKRFFIYVTFLALFNVFYIFIWTLNYIYARHQDTGRKHGRHVPALLVSLALRLCARLLHRPLQRILSLHFVARPSHRLTLGQSFTESHGRPRHWNIGGRRSSAKTRESRRHMRRAVGSAGPCPSQKIYEFFVSKWCEMVRSGCVVFKTHVSHGL